MTKRIHKLRQAFLDTPRSHLRIALMLSDKKLTKKELIEICSKLGKSPLTIEREIRYMISNGIIGETREGLLYLKNPSKYYYIVLYGKGTILDRWFTLMIPTSILALIFSTIDITITQFMLFLLLLMSIGFIIDLRLHRLF